MSGYKEALEAAGAKVHRFFEAGSYQGEWYALVWFAGHLGWVTGGYGSCSGCDAFEAEFGFAYNLDEEQQRAYNERLRLFGLSYLGENGEQVHTHEELMKKLVNQQYIGMDDEEAIEKLNQIGEEMGFARVERTKGDE